MNTNAIIIAELKRRRAKAAEALARADDALAFFSDEGIATSPAKKKPGRKKDVNPVRSEALKKAWAARKEKSAAKKTETGTELSGASLARAAEE